MGHIVEDLGDVVVIIEPSDFEIISCESVRVCGQVRTKDGMFDQRICTTLVNPKFLRTALARLKQKIENELCGEADSPEQCVEYYEDYIDETACDKLDAEWVADFIDYEEVAEALARAAEDHIPDRPRGLLRYIKKR